MPQWDSWAQSGQDGLHVLCNCLPELMMRSGFHTLSEEKSLGSLGSTPRHGKPSICRSIIHSTIFTNISYIFFFFFTRSAIYNPSPRCREVVQQITTFDYMDFEAVRKGWFDGSSMDCSWRFSVRNRRKRPGFLRLQRARDSCILADMDECRPTMSGFPQWATTGWMNPCNWSYHFLVLAIAQKVQKTLWALSISPRQPFVPRKRGKATKTCSRRGIRTHLTTLLSPQSRFEAGSL